MLVAEIRIRKVNVRAELTADAEIIQDPLSGYPSDLMRNRIDLGR